ncbi:MAG: type II secretion system protein [Lachnospiraceae bacterium]|nr:type II secretion system protein [Lachnospiraceae bacterium]
MVKNESVKVHSVNNKGFTLVELIVALVILSILAAVGVPGLLSYIDDYRQKEILSHAQAAFAAAQAEVTKCYDTAVGNQKVSSMLYETIEGSTRLDKIAVAADMPAGSKAGFRMKKYNGDYNAVPADKDAWIVYYLAYWESETDKTAVAYNGDTGEWETGLTCEQAMSRLPSGSYFLLESHK